MVKLSIIVPVYNVERYLRKCVDSLLDQDYCDYEIILVEDGSTDRSSSICDEYDLMFENIHAIHQPNGGLSAARNTGIEAAHGEHICFVDSDDYWEPNVLGELMAQIERDNLEVLRFKYQNVNERYEAFNPYKRDRRLENDYSETVTDGISFLNERMNTQCYAVMYIIRRDLLEGCIFTPGIYFEDADWTPRMLVRAKRVASTDTIVYNYLMREGSITNAVNRSKQKKVLEDKMRLVESLQRQSRELKAQGQEDKWFSSMIADTVISIIGILSVQFYQDKKIYLYRLNQMNLYPLKSTSFKARLINLSPRLFLEILHIKNK